SSYLSYFFLYNPYFYNMTASTDIFSLSLHDALPIFDRGIEPVEHIVHARGFRDALAIATIERIERAAQHRLEHIDHAQRLARGAGERDAGRLTRRPVEIEGLRWIGGVDARRQKTHEQPG